MGLLDLFKRKSRNGKAEGEEPPETGADLEIYSGIRVEVTSFEGRLLFVARLRNVRGNTGELYQYSESEVSEIEEPVRVRIRGYHDRAKEAVYMEGTILPQPFHIWQVEELTVTGTGNDRAFFRLSTNVDATAVTFGGAGAGDRPCKLLNISVGGACIASEQTYHEGDKFLLKVKLLEDRDMSAMFCQVMRIIDKGDGKFEYGCRFLELNEADQDKITQNIFAVQRRQRGSF